MIPELVKRNIYEKTKVVGYVRVSTKKQVDYGHSMDYQEDEIRDFCTNNNLDLVEVFEDRGITGTAGDGFKNLYKREGLFSMFNFMHDNGIKYVVVLETSRLWRDDDAQIIVKQELYRCKADVISINRPSYSIKYSQSPTEKFINSILEALDGFERSRIIVRTQRGLQKRFDEGENPSGALPLGYKYANTSRKNVIVNVKEKEIIYYIFRLYALGLTYEQIADRVNNKGFKTRQGKDFSKYAILRIIKNDFYQGIITYKGEKRKGNHPLLIQTKTMQEILKMRKSYKKNENVFIVGDLEEDIKRVDSMIKIK